MNVKRWIALLLALALTFGLTACSSKEASWQEQYDLGVRYLSEGNYEEAILAFTAAIEIDPKRAEAYTGRGDAYMQTGDPAQAEHDYRMAWELAPDDLDTAEKLADALVDQGILEEAAGILEDLIEKDPSNPDYYDKLADIYDQLGQPDKAEEVLQNGVDATGDEGLRQKLEEAQSGIPPVPDDGIQRQVMEISSGEELVELSYTSGLKDLEIRLGDGDYNVDGLMFMSAENVSIVGTGATRLVSASGAETIVSLYDCDNFLLYGLVMGHDLEPYMTCSTGVVELLSSDGVKIVGCDIYGCGLHGINADSSSFTADSCIIRDCSDHGALIWASDAEFNDCTFSGNCYKTTSNPLFQVSDASSSVKLTNCVLKDNLSQSKYDLNYGASDWSEEGTTESGNAWQ